MNVMVNVPDRQLERATRHSTALPVPRRTDRGPVSHLGGPCRLTWVTVDVRTAHPDEATALSELALRSKGYWGYGEDFLEACRNELTYSPTQCASGDVFVADECGELLGFSAIDGAPPDGELQALFVDVGRMGRGVGEELLRHVLNVARAPGYNSLTLEADPGAEPFYVRYGAVRIGVTPSGSIPGRVLPMLRFDIA